MVGRVGPKRAGRSGGGRSIVAPAAAPLTPLEDAAARIAPLVAAPALFFAPDTKHAQACVQTAKILYDLSKSTAPSFLTVTSSVPQLLTHARSGPALGTGIQFTSEQIYAQLALHATPLMQRMDQQIRVLQEHVQQAAEEAAAAEEEEDEEDAELDDQQEIDEDNEDAEEDDEDAELDDGEDEEMDGEDDEEEENADADETAEGEVDEFRGRGGVTEDAFFSLDDMERFADMYEGEEDEGEIDGEDDDREDGEDDGGEDDEEEEEEEDEALDLDALRRKSIRAKHEASLKPFARPLREEEVDLDEDVGEVDPNRPEKYSDFFDAPPAGLLRQKGKKGNKGGKSLEDMYAEEDAQEYVDDDDMDEFGGAFKDLSTSAREGNLSKARVGGNKAEEEEEAAAADEANETPEGELSNYERSQRKLNDQISSIEKKLVQPREWAQLGEVTGKSRPVDSLLDHHLEFEHAGKVAQPITQEYTEELEAMIRRRILKEDFNDVVRKTEADLPRGSRSKPREEVSDEKSAVGLAEVYEQEYMAQQKEAEGRPSAAEEKTNAAHATIAGLVGALFHKLDALCNFHYTPRNIHADELEVTAKPNVSAIAMEEVLPTHMSSAAHVAPQEVYDVSQQAMVGNTEKTGEEKKNRRRRVKAMRKKAFDANQSKESARMRAMGTAATEGNAEAGVLRKAISSKEMKAALTARNVVQAGGKMAGGGAKPAANSRVIAHGQNTKFSNSSAFFGKMQGNADSGRDAKKPKLR